MNRRAWRAFLLIGVAVVHLLSTAACDDGGGGSGGTVTATPVPTLAPTPTLTPEGIIPGGASGVVEDTAGEGIGGAVEALDEAEGFWQAVVDWNNAGHTEDE